MTVGSPADLPELRRSAPAFFLPQGAPAVAYGPGALDRLYPICESLGSRRILVVTTRSLAAEGGVLDDVVRRLGDRWTATFSDSRQHTPDDAVRAGRAAFAAHGCDAVVSVGGGSAIDTAKGIVLSAATGDDLSAFHATVEREGGTASLRRGALHDRLLAVARRRAGPVRTGAGALPSLAPHVAVPTTLSGAEYTDHAGITTAASGRKEQVYHPDLVPAVVVLDPAATSATPTDLWLSTGIKVLDHVVEILYSPQTSAPSEALCLGALRRVIAHLAASADPSAVAARGELQIAAWLAVAGYPNQAAGISHAVDHQLGGYCGVPHGIGACCILPQAMRFNRLAAPRAFALMAGSIGVGGVPDPLRAAGDGRPGVTARSPGSDSAHGPLSAADRVIAEVEALIDALRLPRRLRDVGVARDALARVAELALADAAIAGNPRPVHDAGEILEGVLVPAW